MEKREPEFDKVVDLALNTTIDCLLGSSDTNALDATKENIQDLNDEEAKELSDSLMQNMETIFESEKEKFNLTDEEMEIMKVAIIKNFLKDIDEKE